MSGWQDNVSLMDGRFRFAMSAFNDGVEGGVRRNNVKMANHFEYFEFLGILVSSRG